MSFTPMDAAAYRALDDEAFEKRFAEVKEILDADVLPEGVTDEMVFEEFDVIKSDMERRARKNALSDLSLDSIRAQKRAGAINKAADAVASDPVATSAPKQERGFKAVSDKPFTSSYEYRKALHDHILRIKPMSGEMLARAYQERANTPVSMNAAYSNMTDTFTNTISGVVVAPMELSDEVIRETREQSVLLPKINQTQIQGMYAVSELDLQATGAWIGDKEVSPYQEEYDPEVFTWTWHQFECRFARTFLAEAIMRDNYKAQLAPAMAECYAAAMDAAIISGNGTSQPKGIINDVRLIGTDGKGKTTDGTPDTVGKALVVNVTADDVDDWSFWASLLWKDNFNRLYRNNGELVVSDGTWGNHINVLRDDVDRPIATWDPLNREQPMTLRGAGPVSTVANSFLPSFDQASSGDVIGFYGNLRNYTMNFQPGMPLTTTSWDDHETNTHKTKLLVACDGRVSNPFGWIILKKYVAG